MQLPDCGRPLDFGFSAFARGKRVFLQTIISEVQASLRRQILQLRLPAMDLMLALQAADLHFHSDFLSTRHQLTTDQRLPNSLPLELQRHLRCRQHSYTLLAQSPSSLHPIP